MYYLQSRYYDPEVGRFLNADDYPSTGQGLTGNNMFAYCGNNPVSKEDPTGRFWGIATLLSAVVGGVISAVSDAVVQFAESGTVDVGQTLVAGVAGAISGACALIPGGKVASTLISGGINAALSAGSYAVNQWRQGKNVDLGEMTVNGAIGFVSGVAGNLFRIDSTGAMREAGEALINKAGQKFANGLAKGVSSTIKRSFQYWDRGVSMIMDYAVRAGTNSGAGSAVGVVLGALFT